jgi:hypothetical protein
MDLWQVIRKLKSPPTGIFEASQKITFHCYRHMKDGSNRQVEVTIFDGGEDAENSRYLAEAHLMDERGQRTEKGCSGNGGPTIEQAIAVMHWGDLDK